VGAAVAVSQSMCVGCRAAVPGEFLEKANRHNSYLTAYFNIVYPTAAHISGISDTWAANFNFFRASPNFATISVVQLEHYEQVQHIRTQGIN
jgi:hypothetical protein